MYRLSEAKKRIFIDGLMPSLRTKLSGLSEFMREIRVNFARFYNPATTGGVIFGVTDSKA